MSRRVKICVATVVAIGCAAVWALVAAAGGPDPAPGAHESAGAELIARGRIAGGTSWTLRTTRPHDGEEWCLRYVERTPRTGEDSSDGTCGRRAAGRAGSALFQIDCSRERLAVVGGGRGVAAVELRARRRHRGRTFAAPQGATRDRFFVAHLARYRSATFVALDGRGRRLGEPVPLPRLTRVCRSDTGTLASFPFTF